MTTPISDLEWHAWRSNGVGASDIAGLVLPGKWSSPWSVWASKVGLVTPTESTPRQRIGQRMEAVLAAEFEDARPGLVVVGAQRWCQHADHPWARCTVDGFVTHDPNQDNGGIPVDAPLPDPFATTQFKTDARYGWPDGPPANYRAQCIWEMGVTGMRHCFLAVMFGGFRFEVFDIPWDDDVQADWDLMFTTAERFWFDHVVTGEPPPVDGSDATTDALADVYPDHQPGVEVELDGLADLIVERDDLKDRAKATKARLAEIDNTIRARFGDAEVGTFDGEPVFTLRAQTRAAHQVAESTFRVLRPVKAKGKS